MYTRSVMPDLSHRLQTQDLGFLKIVAELWGIELTAPDARTALLPLTRKLLDPALVLEIIEALPGDARQALDTLLRNAGWMPWTRFTQKYGQLREVGPGKRDREKPYLEPVSPAEVLWYRALIGRDFLRRGGKLQECAYIPDDLLAYFPEVKPEEPQLPGRPASPGETAHIQLVTDRILDHTCTLLASLRLGEPKRSPIWSDWQPPFDVVYALLAAMKLITSSEQPVPEDARPFLEMPRGEALAWLVRMWLETEHFNELHLMPGILCEGSWHNDPVNARHRILAWLSQVPLGTWWHLGTFIKAVFRGEPDFQRPSGDFDTWLVRDAHSGEPINGLKHWEQVDGALIRYLITGPLHWFGLVDLASPAEGQAAEAFRFSGWSEQLLLGKPVEGLPEENQPLIVLSDGTITATPHTSRLARYQVSRFCLWTDETDKGYTYRVTPASLSAAAKQGLKTAHLEILLDKHSEDPPPTLLQALRQWDQKGSQVRIHPAVVLRVENPRILQALRESPAGRFLGDPLGPTTVILNPGAEEKVSAALARLGYLVDVEYSLSNSDPSLHPEL